MMSCPTVVSAKARPILFSAPMVRALLDGSKTQTRRAVKLPHQNPLGQWEVFHWGGPDGGRTHDGQTAPFQHAISHSRTGEIHLCPYGQPGERLWVREAFDFLPSGGPDEPQACEIVYWAGGATEPRTAPHDYNPMIYGREKVRPGIHMPRWASRLTLEIVSVRVERLQAISEADAKAEGAKFHDGHGTGHSGWRHDYKDVHANARSAYARLWQEINGAGSWDANPWVWAVEFKAVQS
jgi:hypothetical protein